MARARAQAAVDAYPVERTSREAQLALANLASIEGLTGDLQTSLVLAHELEAVKPARELALIAKGLVFLGGQSIDADFVEGRRLLEEVLAVQQVRGREHYEGITHLNLAESCRALDLASETLVHADRSIELLGESSAGTELPTAFVLRGWALHHLGHPSAANEAIAVATSTLGPARSMCLVESADVEAAYGDPTVAWSLLAEAEALGLLRVEDDLRRLVQADLHGRQGEIERAQTLMAGLDEIVARSIPAFIGRCWFGAAQMELRAGRDPSNQLHVAHTIFDAQHATYWLRCVDVVRALADSVSERLTASILATIQARPVFLTICADDLALRLGEFRADLRSIVFDQARLRSVRWRPVLRRVLREGDKASVLAAAEILDEIGELDDIPRLRALARMHRGTVRPSLGRVLARRLAPRAHVSDLGHVVVRVGDHVVDGSSIRRKVLTLMCYLLTKPGFAAARDQVLEALWPDLDPDVAVNSLNQTVYFLRRIFEPHYVEDESANYVNHDGELVRLDPELVSSQTRQCQRLLEAGRRTLDPGIVDQISDLYEGRFAIDFEYDDWASPFRESLHAAYLDVVEQAIRADMNVGKFDRAALIAQRAIQVDPDASELEAVLLYVYRRTGSHAAAAEQYSHYAAVLRADGLEPPPLDSL
jgi:DNA-binding SARP family transcriptional activator